MKQYRIVLKKSVQKDIRGIPKRALQKIQSVIMTLCTDPMPQGCEKVRGYDHVYRVRVGQYRVVYEVEKVVRIVTIIHIGHRKDVYKSL